MVSIREIIKDLICDILGSIVLAVGIYSFVEPLKIAPGGVSGIALMINYLTDLPVGMVTFAINVPLVIVAWIVLGRDFAVKTLVTALISTVMLDNVVTPVFPQYVGDKLLSAIVGGVLMGLGMGLVFRRGSTTGGTDIISCIIKEKRPNLPIGRALLTVDITVIIFSMIVFKTVETGMYAAVCLYATAEAIDSVVPDRRSFATAQ